jgi:hypothetical protein
VVAVVALALVPSRIAPTYRSTASVLLVPPTSSKAGDQAPNPYLNFNYSLVIAARVVSLSLADPGTIERLRASGAVSKFTVSPPANDIPVVTITVDGANPDQVRLTSSIAIQAMKGLVRTQQQQVGAPAPSLVQAVVVNQSAEPLVVKGNQHRAAAAIIGLALVLAVVMAFLIEALAQVRDRRRAAKHARQLDEGDQAPPVVAEQDPELEFSPLRRTSSHAANGNSR